MRRLLVAVALLASGCFDFTLPSLDGGGSDGGASDGAPFVDGLCAGLASADLASTCADPGPGSCIDYESCVTSCNGDSACASTCHAKNQQYIDDANRYMACRAAALTGSGKCAASCADGSPTGQQLCIACLHVCTHDSSCKVGCSCGACAAELAVCYGDL